GTAQEIMTTLQQRALKKAKFGAALAVVLELLAYIFQSAGPIQFLFSWVYYIASCLLFIWACTNYAMAKGLPNGFGYLGMLNVFGLIILYLVPSRKRGESKGVGA